MPIGCFLDESRIITERRVTAVYDAMYRMYFYAATDKIGIMIPFSRVILCIFACRQRKILICYDVNQGYRHGRRRRNARGE